MTAVYVYILTATYSVIQNDTLIDSLCHKATDALQKDSIFRSMLLKYKKKDLQLLRSTYQSQKSQYALAINFSNPIDKIEKKNRKALTFAELDEYLIITIDLLFDTNMNIIKMIDCTKR